MGGWEAAAMGQKADLSDTNAALRQGVLAATSGAGGKSTTLFELTAGAGPTKETTPGTNALIHPLRAHNEVKATIAEDMQLRALTNRQYVDVVNHDSKTPVATEWLVFTGIASGKAGAKAYFANLLGATAGEATKRIGIGIGVGTGLAAGAFTAYELSSIWRNNQRIAAFEERLLQPYDPGYKPPIPSQLPSIGLRSTATSESRRLGVSEVVDSYLLPGYNLARKYSFGPPWDYLREHKLGRPPERSAAEMASEQSHMSDARFMHWAEKAASYTQQGQAAHDAAFGVGGYLGGWYMASHLIPHISKYAMLARVGSPALRVAGACLGVFLSRIKTTADERQLRADLLEQRLLQRSEKQN